MKYEQNGSKAITELASEMNAERVTALADQSRAGIWPVGSGRLDKPDQIIKDLFKYLRRAGGHDDLVANLKTLQANFNGEERWIQDFHEIIYDAWQTKELSQEVALTFMDRATALFSGQGTGKSSPSTAERIAITSRKYGLKASGFNRGSASESTSAF